LQNWAGKQVRKKEGWGGGDITYDEWKNKYWNVSRYQNFDRQAKQNAESLQKQYPEYFKRYSFSKEYNKAYINLDDEKIKSLKESNPEYFEQYFESEKNNNNYRNQKKYLSKFPIRFQRLIREGVLKKYYMGKNSHKIILPTSPIKNKQELLDFINDRPGDIELFTIALGIDKNILERQNNIITQAIIDKINEYDP